MRPMTCSRILSLSLLEQLQQDSLNNPYLKFRGLNKKTYTPGDSLLRRDLQIPSSTLYFYEFIGAFCYKLELMVVIGVEQI